MMNSFSNRVSKVNITARNFDFCMEAEKDIKESLK